MASAEFTEKLREVDQFLEESQRQMHALGVQADLEGLPAAVLSTIKRKYGTVGYAREDLRDLPKIIAQAEEEEARKERTRRAVGGDRR